MKNLRRVCLVLLMKNIVGIGATMFQEQYHLIENCKDHAPASSNVYSTQIEDSIFRCAKQCQINLACQSFAYKYQTSQCLLSRKNISTCDDLEANSGSKSYKV